MEKEFKLHGYTSTHGRSSAIADCPFCHAVIVVYLWSFNGCGKRCACGAKLRKNGVATKEE